MSTPGDESPAVVLLDFIKAYDMINRDFLLLTLKKFGFQQGFVHLIGRLHYGTTASFAVNGELSAAVPVRSGIRQGCPLAPLLFIIAAEVLALVIQADPKLPSIPVPGGRWETVKVAAFVDDTAVYLRNVRTLPILLDLLGRFERLSGLQVQPKKSVLILLNKATFRVTCSGIPVLQPGATTRYLGVQVGHGETSQVNWDKRIAGLRVRLVKAAQVTTTVIERVAILNAIVLPAILFSARFCKASDQVLQQLENFQKQFLWNRKLSTQGRKHKFNPGLLFSPVSSGGVGLLSIRIAIKAMLMRQATWWLLADDDVYTTCWRHLLVRGRREKNDCTPQTTATRRMKAVVARTNVAAEGLELVNQHWTLLKDRPKQWVAEAVAAQKAMYPIATVSWPTDGRGELHLESTTAVPPLQISPVMRTFNWADNPWVIGRDGAPLQSTRFMQARQGRIALLELTRTSESSWSFVPRRNGQRRTLKREQR